MRPTIIFTGAGEYRPHIRNSGECIWLYCYERNPLYSVYVGSLQNALTFADLHPVLQYSKELEYHENRTGTRGDTGIHW